MSRRPRPASRRPPPSAALPLPPHNSQRVYSSARQPHRQQSSESESDPDESSGEEEEEDDSGASSGGASSNEEEALGDMDIDAPRVAQYVDEEELDGFDEDEIEAESSSDEEEPSHLTTLQQNDLASLSFGALRKAQGALARASALSGSEDEGSDDDQEEDDLAPEESAVRTGIKGKGREIEESAKSKQEIPKRSSKHAPQEVTSKKPAPRKKLVVEKVVPRDPRFLPLAGEFSEKRFQSQYGFLSELHTQEMKTLRDNLKRARKLLLTSPRDLREEREQEVQRLERALKRAESMVNKDRREKVNLEALDKVAKEEKEKRKAGKGAWYLKNADKKDLLLRAKYDALAASGGQGAVKKAIEKKQKKVNQKEKKRRPFAPGQSGGAQRKRLSTGSGDDGQRAGKRRRVG